MPRRNNDRIAYMKKVCYSFLVLLFSIAKVVAQSDSQISQYTFFPAAFNPAAVGESGMIQLAGIHRMDYLNMGKGVNTTNFGVNMPFAIGKSLHGGGVRFILKEQGTFWAYQNAYLQYAFKKQTSIGKFSIGVDFGFINSRIDGEKAEPTTPHEDESESYHDDEDNVIPQAEASGMKLDLNLGLFYSFRNGYVGISATHITKPNLDVDEFTTDSISTAMHIVAAYEYKIPDTKLVLKPHTLFKTDFVFFDWDIGAMLEYNEKLWGGLSYRIGNTVGVKAGLNIAGGLSVGLVYDLPVTRMITTVGSAELIVQYNFEYILNKHTKKYKSIRIL